MLKKQRMSIGNHKRGSRMAENHRETKTTDKSSKTVPNPSLAS
jgi:hypothetical protein